MGESKFSLDGVLFPKAEVTFNIVYNPEKYANATITLDDISGIDAFEPDQIIEFVVDDTKVTGRIADIVENTIYIFLNKCDHA